MVKRLSKQDIEAIKRFEKLRRAKPFITYDKRGNVRRHILLSTALTLGKAQSLLRKRRSFVDKDVGKFIRNIKIFEPKIKKKR